MKTKIIQGIEVPYNWNGSSIPYIPNEPKEYIETYSTIYRTGDRNLLQSFEHSRIDLKTILKIIGDLSIDDIVIESGNSYYVTILKKQLVLNKKYDSQLKEYKSKMSVYLDWLKYKNLVDEAKAERHKKRKYEAYLKLKEEFESTK